MIFFTILRICSLRQFVELMKMNHSKFNTGDKYYYTNLFIVSISADEI